MFKTMSVNRSLIYLHKPFYYTRDALLARSLLRQRGWMDGWMSHAGIVSKRLNLA